VNQILCAYCEKPAEPPHKDHVVPRSRGGRDEPYNIVIACAACNLSKGDRLPSEWRSDLSPHVLLLESRNAARVTNRDKRPRWHRAAPPTLGANCDVCRRPLVHAEHDCGNKPVLQRIVENTRVYWFREVEQGIVVDVVLTGNGCHCYWRGQEDMHLGAFSVGVVELDKLRAALRELRWEDASRARAEAIIRQLEPVEGLVNPYKRTA
jgi:HNH endonuclease